MKYPSVGLFACFSVFAVFGIAVHADPLAELANFSAFPSVSLDDLAGGKIQQQRGNPAQFTTGLEVQSVTVLDAPVGKVSERLQNWDPCKHAELKVHCRIPAQGPVSPEALAGLKNLPSSRTVAYLIDSTAKIGSGGALQLNDEEARLWVSSYAPRVKDEASRKEIVAEYWASVLSGRINLFLNGRYSSPAGHFKTADGDIDAVQQIQTLLQSDSRIMRQFSDTLQNTPFGGASGAATPTYSYGMVYDVEDQATVAAGSVYLHRTSDGGYQCVDGQYYENFGVYAEVEMEQLWPVQVAGHEQTLMWRSDMAVPSSDLADLHGTARMAATMLMLQDVQGSINAFRAELK